MNDNSIKPLVTVVIPTYNHAKYLGKALQSVFDQTFYNWEIIVELANKIGVNIGFSNLNELRVALASKHAIFNNISEITKAAWKKSEDKNSAALDSDLSTKDYNFYLTNYIARSSRTLNQC